MARIKRSESGAAQVWLSANDTYAWANRPGNRWPCSQLANRRVYAQFEANGDLCDMQLDGGRGEQDCDANEFNAITQDALQFGSKYFRS